MKPIHPGGRKRLGSPRSKFAITPSAEFIARDAVSTPLQQFGVSDLKAHCLEIISNVAERGQSFIITKHGEPVARIVPYESKRESLEGCLKGELTIHGDIINCNFADEWEVLQ